MSFFSINRILAMTPYFKLYNILQLHIPGMTDVVRFEISAMNRPVPPTPKPFICGLPKNSTRHASITSVSWDDVESTSRMTSRVMLIAWPSVTDAPAGSCTVVPLI